MADLTFLMNADPPGSANQFYTLAKQYFVAAGSTVIDAPANGQTLEGVFTELKSRKVAGGTINLVSHASAFAAMICPVTLASQAAGYVSMSADDLQEALAAKSLTPPGPGVITDKTRIVIYGCDVGRSLRFLTMLSGLFGNPGEVLAPRRLSIFRLDGSTVKYRQAQTWSLVRKAPLIPAGASVPAGGWPAYQAAFVKDATDKFARTAIAAEITGEDRLKAILTTAASNATTTFGPTFFIQEGIDILFPAPPSAADLASSVKPRPNGDPVTAAAQSAAQVDDTTQVTTVTAADAYPANAAKTKYAITVIVLAQVIDADVLIAEGPGYSRLSSGKERAPSPGPKPVGGGAGSGGSSGAGASNDQLQTLTDKLLADGATQQDVDELGTDIPQGDATEGLAMDSPDDSSDTGDPIDLLLPTRLELA